MTIGSVAWGNLNVPHDVYDAAVRAGQEYRIDPAVLLSIGYYESGFNTAARNTSGEDSVGWLQFNRAAGNGSRRLDKDYDVAALMDPYHSARLAARHISSAMANGNTLYDAIQPWSTRDNAYRLYQENGPIAAVSPTITPIVTTDNVKPDATSGPIPFAQSSVIGSKFPSLTLGKFGPWDLSFDTSPLFKLGVSVGAFFLLFLGIKHMSEGDR